MKAILSRTFLSVLTLAIFAIGAPTFVRASNVNEDAYFHALVGGDFPMSNYGRRNSRFAFGFEGGNQFIGLPITFSYGEKTWIIGAKPRVQYFFAPLASMPQLRFAPGLGGVFNFWRYSESNLSVSTFEIGVGLSGHMQYVLNDQISIMLSPLNIDLNFWRHASAQGSGFDESASETELRTIYSTFLGVGVIF